MKRFAEQIRRPTQQKRRIADLERGEKMDSRCIPHLISHRTRVETRLLLLPQEGNAMSAKVLELMVMPVSVVMEPGSRGILRAGLVRGGDSVHAITVAAKV